MVRRDEEDFIGESSLGERDKRLEENKQFHRKECTRARLNGASNEEGICEEESIARRACASLAR
jgi:hypothetical protein